MSLYEDLPAPTKASDPIVNESKEVEVKEGTSGKEKIKIHASTMAFLPSTLKRKANNVDKGIVRRPVVHSEVLQITEDSIVKNTDEIQADPLRFETDKPELESIEKQQEEYEVYDPKIPNDFHEMVKLRDRLKLGDQLEVFDETGNRDHYEEKVTNKIKEPVKIDLALSGEEAYLRRLQLSNQDRNAS